MKVKELKSEGLNHEFEITVPANDIDARVEAKLVEVGQTVALPGFRQGKVPMNILKQKYGNAIMGEVLEAAVNEISAKTMDDKKIKPAMQPKIEVKSFDAGKDLVFTMAVETLPEIKIKDVKGVKFDKPVADVAQTEVDDALKRIAENNTVTQPIEGKRATKEGDTVVMDFDGRTADDNVKQPGMAAEGHNLKLGSGQFIPGFEDQLIGKKAGDEIEVKVQFPENYGAAELAGREAIFDVKIHEIREEAEAKIDDEFAKTLGMDDVKALEAAVKEQMEKELEQHSRLKLKKNLLDFLDAEHDFKAPQGMLDAEFENILHQVQHQNGAQSCDDHADVSDEEKEELRVIADRRVRLGLILSEIGQGQNITVADAELQKAVITEAQKYPGQEKDVFDYYSKNRDAIESLRGPLFEDKVVDYLLELADVKDVKVSVEELTADPDAEDAKPAKKKAAAKKKPAAKKDADEKPAAKKKAAPKKKAAAKK